MKSASISAAILADALAALICAAPQRPLRPILQPMTAAIVVPVYGAAEALSRCLASLERSTDLVRNPLILAIDGPQDPATERVLEAAPASAERVRLAARGGFAAAANAGLAVYPDRDAILLNSDTQVAAGWVEGLAEAAMSQANVASVTPFSNAATIASLPRWLDDNALPAGHGVESFAALVRAVSRRDRPQLDHRRRFLSLPAPGGARRGRPLRSELRRRLRRGGRLVPTRACTRLRSPARRRDVRLPRGSGKFRW